MNEDFYKNLLDNLYDGVYFVDKDRNITYWNKGAERISGYFSKDVIGKSCKDNVLNHVTAEGTQLCLDRCPLIKCLEDGTSQEADVFLHHADGHRVPVIVRATPIRDKDQNIVGAVEAFSRSDESSLCRQIHELRKISRTDSLTGVSNRANLEGRLRALLAELKYTNNGASLLFVDIDRFKPINDTYGHLIGDKIIRMVATTLCNAIRETDLVGRYGGDEFLVILYDVNNPYKLKCLAEKLRVLVESCRLDVSGGSITATVSIGGTLWRPSDTVETLVKRADNLMYESKEQGGNSVTVDNL